MNSKVMKILKVLILIIGILIVCIISILVLKMKLNDKEEKIATPESHIEVEKESQVLELISNKKDYAIAKSCTNNFLINCSQIFNIENDNLVLDDSAIKSNEELKKQYIQNVFNMLDETYIVENNIVLENLENKLKKINKFSLDITNIYKCSKSDNITIYFVYGNIIDISGNKSVNFKIMLKVDIRNRTFKVLLDDYIEKHYKDIEVGQQIDIDIQNQIENNGYNVYKYENISDEEYLSDLIISCKMELLYSIKDLYNKLDDEYKKNRFSTIDELKDYVEENKKEITNMKLYKYQKNVYDEYVEYICIDNNNRYYIINENSTLNYKIMLDTYTINTPQFKKRYDNADDVTKVGYNLEKIKNAVNNKDYKYIYDKLNYEFKQNNYSNYNYFENILKSNMFEKNIFTYDSIDKEQSVYVSYLDVSDAENENNEKKKITIIMKLNKDYEFEISFSIDN